MQAIQLFLTKNKKSIVKLLKIGWLLIIAIFIATIKISNPDKIWSEFGEKAGSISLVSFWIVLFPGIMKRLKINQLPTLVTIRSLLMLYRRQIGMNMYIFAIVHYGWSRVLPVLASGGNLLEVSPFEAMGFMAFALATPLFITSNDFSQHGKLKKIWPKIHSLVYVIIWLLFLHTALNESDIKSIITLIIAILEIISLFVAWKRKKQAGEIAKM